MTKTTHIADLIPDKQNARRHNPRNIGLIVNALHEVGAARSIVIDEDGLILAGNATIEAAALAGIERLQIVEADGETVVAVRRTGLTPEQKRRLAYYDNRTAELADWDPEQVLADLDAGVDLSGLFDKGELDELLKGIAQEEPPKDPGPQIDRAAELQEKWGTALGQIWQLGEHRLAVGDCTDIAVIEAIMKGERARLFVTDPPYGVGYEYASHNDADESAYFVLCRGFMANALKLDCFGLVTVGHKHNNWWIKEFDPDSFLIWYDKTKQSPHKIAHLCKSELILSFGKPNGLYDWDTLEVQGIRGDGMRDLHTCPKPVELFVKLIEPQTERGDIVVDFFVGSGTSLIACEQMGRIGRGIEIEPKYCAVTIQRWVDLTGGEPRLIES